MRMRAYNYRGVENKNVYRTYQICIRLFGHATQPNRQTQKKQNRILCKFVTEVIKCKLYPNCHFKNPFWLSVCEIVCVFIWAYISHSAASFKTSALSPRHIPACLHLYMCHLSCAFHDPSLTKRTNTFPPSVFGRPFCHQHN